MQERRLRLGDVLDDYCPREKRLTNHVIVALVGDDVRTTRCSTCDTEHVYKEGKVPVRRRKADPQASLYKTVLENITGRDAETGAPVTPTAAADPPSPPPVVARVVAPPVVETPQALPPALAASTTDEAEPVRTGEEPVHRHTLIRATLPKVEGQIPERKPADFTLWNVARQPQGRRGARPRSTPGAGSSASWGNYSPYANGHPSGKNVPPQGGQQPGRGRQNRRGR